MKGIKGTSPIDLEKAIESEISSATAKSPTVTRPSSGNTTPTMGIPGKIDKVPESKEIQKAAKLASSVIDKQIKEDGKVKKNSAVILLGSADSGKTTILKQFALSYGVRFTAAEKAHFKTAITNMVRKNFVSLLEGLNSLGLLKDLEIPDLKVNFHYKQALVISIQENDQTFLTATIEESESLIIQAVFAHPAVVEKYTFLARDFGIDDAFPL